MCSRAYSRFAHGKMALVKHQRLLGNVCAYICTVASAIWHLEKKFAISTAFFAGGFPENASRYRHC